ncbi:hypothetical protein GCK72_018111 [Caenorhabditis remanei]|uniref:Uncharacterized protein n=1 Tax=Caenorhabditis remanei TaxID=31234 RepID=A0A6A5G915_CAERE|nr:hypothetical protein GCK72_018111 [Caenorhabditis remanei]KAF1751557.1 hypothetical protein GCK72_018111 [Caenorhabditis remanei]
MTRLQKDDVVSVEAVNVASTWTHSNDKRDKVLSISDSLIEKKKKRERKFPMGEEEEEDVDGVAVVVY